MDHGSCWIGGLSWELCCHPDLGPVGRRECWDEFYTYELCCSTSQRLEVSGEPHVVEPSLPWRAESEGIPHRTESLAGDTSLHNDVQTEILAQRRCWPGDHNGPQCCQGSDSGADCWERVEEYALCCAPIADLRTEWVDVRRDVPLAQCLLAVGDARISTTTPPWKCKGHYYSVAHVIGLRVQSTADGQPWWARGSSGGEPFVSRPLTLQPVGGFCAPSACGEDDAARFLAPQLAPWWKMPPHGRSPVGLNATHIRLPPALARSHSYPDFEHAWITGGFNPAPFDPQKTYGFEFAILEHHTTWNLKSRNARVLFAIFIPSLIGCLSFCSRFCSSSFACLISPHCAAVQLTKPRGPFFLDSCRILLTVLVVILNAREHLRWTSVQEGSWADFVWEYSEALHRVNTSFTVLTVYLCLRRGCFSSTRSTYFRGGLPYFMSIGQVFRHVVRRSLLLVPLLAFWTWMFLNVFSEDMPLNHVFAVPGLYTWYGYMRSTCAVPKHLWSSVFLVHELVFAERSLCHNIAIFEGLWGVEIFIFALVSFLGRKPASVAALFMWPFAVYWDSTSLALQKTGYSCCFTSLLPSALATLFLTTWTPTYGSFRSSLGILFAVVCLCCIAGTALLDIAHYNPKSNRLAEWIHEMHPSPQEYCPYGHVYVLPHVFGFAWLLSLADKTVFVHGDTSTTDHHCASFQVPPSEGMAAPCLRATARLSFGINISHIFVLHWLTGFVHEQPMEASVFQLLACSLATLFISVGISLLLFFALEAPIAAAVEFIRL